ncbi:MAG: hypothetical protein IH934_07800, partial [Nanoarchaeota archaeon]|nr:hypothetical protein [Nanoarchaeota archaeon]
MKKRQLGKKGIFLTFIAISIIAVFIVIFNPTDISLRKDALVIKTRVSNINNFVLDLENVYLERILQSTSIKAISSLILYMKAENKFLTDFEAKFTEVLLTGKIDDIPIDDITGQNIMKGNTYINWTDKVINISEDIFNVNINITVRSIDVFQLTPWTITVGANISFSVNSETASWDKNVSIKTKIAIERFDDPYYLINTGGSYINRVNRSNIKFNEWNISNLKDHIRIGTYVHFENSKAPSFVMRFTNTSLKSSCCGIESLVDPNKLSNKDQIESYADYLFFNHT